MAKTVLYRIKRNGKYLQTVDANVKRNATREEAERALNGEAE